MRMSFGCGGRRTLTLATLYSVCVSLAWAQCQVDQFATQQDFDLNKYMGTWYEIYWLPPFYESTEDYWIDFVETYSVNEIGTDVSVKLAGRDGADNLDCKRHTKTMAISPDDSSRMSYTDSYNDTEINYDYWVVATDYDNWSYTYGCDWEMADGTCHKSHGAVWSRKSTLEDTHRAAANASAQATCVSLSDFIVVAQQKTCLETSGSSSLASSALFAVSVCLLTLIFAL